MRLGIDFDNTLADFVTLIQRITRERTGFELVGLRERHPDVDDLEPVIHAAIGRERWESLLRDIHETDLTLDMAPQPGAVEVARRLASQHEIVIVTARNDHESEAVHRWLERYNIAITGFVATGRAPKAPHAVTHGLAVHLDDNVTVFADFDEAHPTIPALIAHPMNARSARAAHWRSVEDWRAFERLVQSLEQER